MKKVCILFAALLFTVAVNAQEKTMYIMKNNAVTHEIAVSNIDSIVFYRPETAVTPGIGEPTATTDPGVVINGVRWATRNLDTGGTFVATPETYGALFQWKRPADGHESRTSGTTDVLATGDTPGHGNFIINWSDPHDWRNPQNDALWNAGTEAAPIKAANDPSPAGWRVPTDAELATLLDGTKVTRAWDFVKQVYTFTDIASGATLILPAAGYRGYNGGVSFEGSDGFYWSSTPDGIYARCMRIGYLYDAHRYGQHRAYGQSIRCVAE